MRTIIINFLVIVLTAHATKPVSRRVKLIIPATNLHCCQLSMQMMKTSLTCSYTTLVISFSEIWQHQHTWWCLFTCIPSFHNEFVFTFQRKSYETQECPRLLQTRKNRFRDHKRKLRSSITPGTVLILVAGPYKGKVCRHIWWSLVDCALKGLYFRLTIILCVNTAVINVM